MQTFTEDAASIPAGIQPVSPQHPLPVALYPPSVPGGAAEATPIEFVKTVAATTVPEPLVAEDTFVDSYSIRALDTNQAPLKFGFSAANDSQRWQLAPTEWRSDRAPAGKRINLKRIYVDVGANGEGVAIHAWA